ncbi:MAG: LptF/LptG family permease [Phycisphaerales bacterium]|nr:LptF/LptG family permease [Phycisphaerales bacterium]
MPGLLTRYVMAELLKTMLLTTAVLVAVIAFGATIKPLAQNLLGGADIFKYVMVASVPMLQYALPFAAGFAATLVMHRLAVDNELLAMSVNGISYGRMFRPLFLIGLGLLLFMMLLVNYGVPYFWGRMESMVARDVTRLLASSVRRGEAFSLGNTQIFADDVMLIDDPEDSEADSRLVLVGVAALETDRNNSPKTEFTADYATLDVYRIDGRAILKLVLGESTIFREGDQALVRVPTAEPGAMDLEQGWSEEPKSLTLSKMLVYRNTSEEFPAVVRVRENAFEELAAREAWNCVWNAVESGEPLVFRDHRRGEDFLLEAGAFDPPMFKGGVSVTEFANGVRRREGRSSKARIKLVDSRPNEPPRFDLFFEPSEVEDFEEPTAPRIRWQARTSRLLLEGCEPVIDTSLSNAELVSAIEELEPGEDSHSQEVHGRVLKAGEEILRTHQNLRWDIDARMQQRFGQSLLAPLLLMLGGVLAVLMKRSVPLLVYLVAFLPAIADILLISTGEQTLRGGPSVGGHALLWSGNALIAFVLAVAWTRMRRC